MAKNDITWIKSEELPEAVQRMLARFESVFGLHDLGYVITYYRDDAVFVRAAGLCSAYALARLVQVSPDILIELEATANNYWTLRMFSADYHRADVQRQLAWIRTEFIEYPLGRSVYIKKELISEFLWASGQTL